jgi:CDGSH-type Zn-finger protein
MPMHYKRLDGGPAETPEEPATIVPRAGGPYYVRGFVQLRTADGSAVLEDVRMALCRCGQSQNKPFCDNSHFRVSFDDPCVIPESAAPAESR